MSSAKSKVSHRVGRLRPAAKARLIGKFQTQCKVPKAKRRIFLEIFGLLEIFLDCIDKFQVDSKYFWKYCLPIHFSIQALPKEALRIFSLNPCISPPHTGICHVETQRTLIVHQLTPQTRQRQSLYLNAALLKSPNKSPLENINALRPLCAKYVNQLKNYVHCKSLHGLPGGEASRPYIL